MKPPRFDYIRADSVEEAIEALAAHGDDARVLAGGQSLVAMLNMRLVAPGVVVDISRVPELVAITRTGDAVEVGAAVTQAQVERFDALETRRGEWTAHPGADQAGEAGQTAKTDQTDQAGQADRFDALETHLPLVARALPFVGHYQTRARGTVCGSIAHADPSSELPLCLAALGGEVVLRSTRGTRAMAAADFQRDVLTTACEPDEMIVAVRFPLHPPGEGCAFDELGIRRGDFAIVAVAALASATRLLVGVGGCSDRPHVVELPPLAGDALADALNALAWSLPFDDDHHASARYRRDLVRILGRRTVEAAMRCRG